MIAYFTYTISSHHNNTGFEKKYWLYCTITVHTNALITSLIFNPCAMVFEHGI